MKIRTFQTLIRLWGVIGHNVAVTNFLTSTPLLSQLEELIAIPSVGGTLAETSAQEFSADLLTSLGLEVHTWEMNLPELEKDPRFPGMEVPRASGLGVIGIWRGNGSRPALLINGHTDVVPPGNIDAWDHDPFHPHHARINDRDVLVGRGSCDMKGGLVSAISAVAHLRRSGFEPLGDIVIAPVIGEEDGGLGTFSLVTEGFPRFYPEGIDPAGPGFFGALIPEPSSLASIPANAGALTFRLRVEGAAIHASRRTEGVSAIEKFYPILDALTALERTRNLNPDPLMTRWPLAYPLSVGTIHAGDWSSTVPDLLIAEGRYGVALNENVDSAKSEFEQCVADACATDDWLRDHPVQVQWWGGQFASGQSEGTAPLLQQLANAHAQVTGDTVQMYGAPYGSDLRLLTGLAAIPTVQYGPGDAGIAHTNNEYVPLDELQTTAAVYSQVITTVLG